MSVLAACPLLLPAAAWSNTTESWNGGAGSWTTATAWSGHVVPNDTSTLFDVTVDGLPAVASSVSLGPSSTSITVNSLNINSGDQVIVNSGAGLTTTTLNDAGILTVNTGGEAFIRSQLSLSTGGSMVASGGTIVVTPAYVIGSAGSQFSITNSGTISFTALDTGGNTVNVQNGTLSVATLTDSAGTIAVGAGGILQVTGAYTQASGHDVTIAAGGSATFGSLTLNGLNFSVPAGASFASSLVDNTSDTFTTSGTSTVGGFRNANGIVNVRSSGSLTSTGGTVDGGTFNVDPTATFAIASSGNGYSTYGAFTLGSGTLTTSSGYLGNNIEAGTITNNGTINVGDKGEIGNGAVTLAGSGMFNFTGGDYEAFLGSVTNNATVKGSGALCRQFGGGTNDSVANNGTIEATTPTTGTSQFTVGGTISTNASGAKMIADANATLSLSSSNFTSNGSITVMAGGTVSFGNGDSPATTDVVTSIQSNGTVLLDASNLSAGSITGTGDVHAEYFDTLSVGYLSCSSVEVGGGSSVTLRAQSGTTGITSEPIGSLTLASDPLTVATAAAATTRIVLQVSKLTYDDYPVPGLSGLLDLTNNDMIVRSGSLGQVNSLLAAAYNGGNWNGKAGITSSTAAADASRTEALGAVLNGSLPSGSIFTTFDSQAVGLNDVLVKFTTYGDNDLNGVVDLNDFNDFVAGLNGTLSGWEGGDYTYSGSVSVATDFPLFLRGYLASGASEQALIVDVSSDAQLTLAEQSQILGQLGVVPEPVSGLAGLATLSLLRRKRRA